MSIWGVVIPVILGLVQCYGQKSTKIDSLKLANGLEGHAMFEYVTKAGNEIKTGDFEFYQSQLDSTNENFAIGLSYEGTYRNNAKTGDWTYSYSRLEPSVLKRLDKTNIIYAGSGKRFGVYGKFNQNKADGEWYSITQEVDFGHVTDTLFLAKCNFDEDQMIGSFEGKRDSITITGEIDEEGFLTGSWIFYQKTKEHGNIEEHRLYENGILVSHLFKIGGEEFSVKHIGLDQTTGEEGEDWKEVNVSREYFNIIYQTNFGVENEKLSLEKTNKLIKQSNNFLKQSIFSFGNHNAIDIWKVDNANNIVYPKLRVRTFPYSEKEKENIEKANEIITSSSDLIKGFLEDPQVDINRYNYKEVSLYFEIYRIYNKELLKLKNIFDRLSLPSYEYIDRSEILPFLIKGGVDYPDEVEYEYKDKKQKESYTFPKGISKKNVSIEKMLEHVEAIYAGLKATKEEVDPIIERNRKRAEIAEKEENLVRLRDSIKDLFENKNKEDDYNEYHERYKTKVVEFTQSEFKKYAQQDIELRIEEIDPLLKCFEEFIGLYTALIEVEEKIERVKEEYTRVVWNPFTFTDMEETVKERVYSAYENKLLPYVFELLDKNLKCENISVKIKNFDLLYNRMLELRQLDTRDLEKELRKTSNVDKVAALFKLSFGK